MIPATQAEAIYPLSPMQEAMLFHSRMSGEGAYVGQMSCTLRGPLNVARFRAAWEALLRRHPALRTSFLLEGVDRPVQVVHRQVTLPIVEEDLRSRPPAERAAHLEVLLAEDRRQPFAPAQPPLMRLRLLRLEDDVTRLLWTRHHVLMDGWSVNVLMEELLALYREGGADSALPPAPPYQAFIDWLKRQDRSAAEAFWRGELAGFQAPTPLLPEEQLRRGEAPEVSLVEEQLRLGPELSGRLRAFARGQRLTLATLLTGAWALVVSRYSGSSDVVFGMTVSGRPADLPGVESTVGLFLNTLPVRIPVPPFRPALLWLRELQEHLARMRQHEQTPLVELRQHAALAPEQPLFSHILVLENYPAALTEGAEAFGDLRIEDYRFIDQTSLPLNVGVAPGPDMLMLAVHDPTRIPRAFVRRLMDNYVTALRSLTEPGDRLLEAVAVVSDAEQRHLIQDLNETSVTWPDARLVPERIAARAAEQPGAVAVKLGERALTYAELDGAAGALARRLVERGVGPESVVGLCQERSPELLVSILAALKAGAAYLPLDPDEPPERLRMLLSDSGARLVLAGPAQAEALSGRGLAVEVVDAATSRERASFPQVALASAQAAYVLFTSGSTGRPKAAINTHGGLANRLLWMQAAYPIGPGDRVLQKTPYTFDVSVWELLWPLMTGATLVLAEPGGHRDPRYVRELIQREAITVAHFVPSMLEAFLREDGSEGCASLRHLVCSGEALTPELRDHAHQRLRASVHNLYGPTEAAIDVSFHDCERSDARPVVPIGRPIANLQLRVLDERLRLVPKGAAGELYIGGVGLARGYLGRPELTAERFVPDPFSREPGARLYRTGDLARLDEEGRLLYLGRADTQVKIRGLRVELGEIEAALSECPGVRECAVTASAAGPGDVRLTGHVVHSDGAVLEGEAAGSWLERTRERLRRRLPEHMLPASFAFHAALPRLTSGKLDRKALARHAGSGATVRRSLEAPRTPVEAELAAIWREVLGLPEVGIRESFFELGGHSLLLTQVGTRIQKAFGVELPLRELFNAPTIVDQTEAIMQRQLQQQGADEYARLMDEVRNLSPEELAALLASEGDEK